MSVVMRSNDSNHVEGIRGIKSFYSPFVKVDLLAMAVLLAFSHRLKWNDFTAPAPVVFFAFLLVLIIVISRDVCEARTFNGSRTTAFFQDAIMGALNHRY